MGEKRGAFAKHPAFKRGDFDEEELNNAIKEYNRRTRNFGGK